jgi:uncharacterized RDD family membrane protein YckC
MTMSAPNYSISTPENVDLHLELAGCGNRILAGLIDKLLTLLVILAVVLICSTAYYLADTLLSKGAQLKSILLIAITVFLILSIFIINFGYFIFFEASWQGQTPGKKFVGIRVVEQNGQPISRSSAWIRNLLRIFDEGCFVVGLIDNNERRIGDFAANTIVIRERLPQISSSDLGLTAKLLQEEHLDIGLIAPQEYELIVAFLKRRQKLDPAHRAQLATKLTNYFANKLQASKSAESEQFLERLFLSYQARAEI